MVVLFLIYWGVSLLFAVMAAPVDTLTNSAWGFSPPPHQHLLFVIFFFWLYKHFIYFCLFVIFLTIAFPVGEVVAHCDFSLCFPDDYDIWHLFMCLLAGWMSYSEQCLPGSQPVRQLERLLLNCPAAWALRVCARTPPRRRPADSALCSAEAASLEVLSRVHCGRVPLAYGGVRKKRNAAKTDVKEHAACVFKSLDHFELILVHGVRKYSSLVLFACSCLVFSNT